MLSDHKFEALSHITRRLRWDSSELTRFFSTVETPPPTSRRKPARATMLLAAAVFASMALLGPRMLTEAEVKTRKRPPLPRTSPPVNPVARRRSPSVGSAAAVPSSVAIDLFPGPPTTIATASCQGRPKRDADSRLLDWEPRHVPSVSPVA